MEPARHQRGPIQNEPYQSGKALTPQQRPLFRSYVRIDKASQAILRDAGSARTRPDAIELHKKLNKLGDDVKNFIKLNNQVFMHGNDEMRVDTLTTLAKTRKNVVTALKANGLRLPVSFSETSTVCSPTNRQGIVAVPTKEDHTHNLAYEIGSPRGMQNTSTGFRLSMTDEPLREIQYDVLSPSAKHSANLLHNLTKANLNEAEYKKMFNPIQSLLYCITDALEDSLDHFYNHPPSSQSEILDHLRGSIQDKTEKLYEGLSERLADDPEACELFKDNMRTMEYVDSSQKQRANTLKRISESEAFDTYIVSDLSQKLDEVLMLLKSNDN